MTERSFVKNTSDRKQVKNAEQKEKFLRQQELRDISFILSSDQGRRYIWRMLGVTKTEKQTYEGDVNWSIFNAGERNIGLIIKADILEADPMSFIKMMLEAKDRSEKEIEPEETKEPENA